MAKIGSIEPYYLELPYTLRTQVTESKFADHYAAQPGINRINATTVEIEGAGHPWLII